MDIFDNIQPRFGQNFFFVASCTPVAVLLEEGLERARRLERLLHSKNITDMSPDDPRTKYEDFFSRFFHFSEDFFRFSGESGQNLGRILFFVLFMDKIICHRTKMRSKVQLEVSD